MRSFRPAFLLAALGLVACGKGVPNPGGADSGNDPPLSDGGAVADLEVGSGASAFEALTDGQVVQIIFGPQGGYHVWTALRANKATLAPDRAEVHVRLLQAGTELSQNAYRLNLVDTGAFYEWYGMQALIPDPTAVDGQTLTLRLELLDSSGRSASDERRITPHKN